jgi:hypothetical protein
MAGRMDEAGEGTLRAKYLDWCSARIAERFLDLSSEEIYALSLPSEGEVAEGAGSGEETYRTLVQRATEVLLERMSLPTFAEWRDEYEASPARFDAEMLGFWKDASGGG